ncbi:MAG: hypothetical protein HY600_02950 [Candidatus Omnitrophica bacterium]|nr:hypothetical protein [Candidatus Omnitrophota bacterium]
MSFNLFKILRTKPTLKQLLIVFVIALPIQLRLHAPFLWLIAIVGLTFLLMRVLGGSRRNTYSIFPVVLWLLVLALGSGSVREGLKRKFLESTSVSMGWTGSWVKLTSPNPPGGSPEGAKIELGEDKKSDQTEWLESISTIVKQQLRGNLISNGDFAIPLSSASSGWGHGLRSDILNVLYPGMKIRWMNFSNASVAVSVEETEIGKALKIVHESAQQPHSIGVMEQYIKVVEKGAYRLSFWAKAPYSLPENALIFSTADNWEGSGVYFFPEVGKGHESKQPQIGPQWEPYSKTIVIDEPGLHTFFLVSQGSSNGLAVVYITDISLTKATETASAGKAEDAEKH